MKKINSLIAGAALSAGVLGFASSASAVEVQVKLTNLTQGMYFTPRLLVAHTSDLALFEAGTVASPELVSVAEGGDVVPFTTLLDSTAAADANNYSVFGSLVAPATTTSTYTFDTENFMYLSMVTMLVPTNDAFVGLNSWKIPTEPGTYTIELNAYDSGSEANSELVADMATPPPTQPGLGANGTGVATAPEGNVHIHRNVLGDTDLTAGVSDLDATVHRWLNPVARLTVTIPDAAAQ